VVVGRGSCCYFAWPAVAESLHLFDRLGAKAIVMSIQSERVYSRP